SGGPLLFQAQPPQASYATCRGIAGSLRVLLLTDRALPHTLYSRPLILPGIPFLLSTHVSSPGEFAHRAFANSSGHSKVHIRHKPSFTQLQPGDCKRKA